MDYLLNDSDDSEISLDDNENVRGSFLNELRDYEKQ